MEKLVLKIQRSFICALIGIVCAVLLRALPPVTPTPKDIACQGVVDNACSETQALSEVARLYEEQILGKNLTIEEYYCQQLKAEEEALWEELETTTGLEYDEVLHVKENLKGRKQRSQKKQKAVRGISPEVLELAYDVFAEFAIDPTDIRIVPGESTCVGENKLILCEKQLRTMPKEGARSVIAHEMIHVLQDDDFMRDAMYGLCHQKRLNPDKFKGSHPFYKHMRFEELRADILSALKDISYARGALESLSTIIELGGDRGYPSHPLTSERIRVIQEIVDLLEYEQTRPQTV